MEIEKLKSDVLLHLGKKINKVDLPTFTETFDYLLSLSVGTEVTDSQISKHSKEYVKGIEHSDYSEEDFINGAKWMREQMRGVKPSINENYYKTKYNGLSAGLLKLMPHIKDKTLIIQLESLLMSNPPLPESPSPTGLEERVTELDNLHEEIFDLRNALFMISIGKVLPERLKEFCDKVLEKSNFAQSLQEGDK